MYYTCSGDSQINTSDEDGRKSYAKALFSFVRSSFVVFFVETFLLYLYFKLCFIYVLYNNHIISVTNS